MGNIVTVLLFLISTLPIFLMMIDGWDQRKGYKGILHGLVFIAFFSFGIFAVRLLGLYFALISPSAMLLLFHAKNMNTKHAITHNRDFK